MAVLRDAFVDATAAAPVSIEALAAVLLVALVGLLGWEPRP